MNTEKTASKSTVEILVRLWDAVNELRAEEGSSVTISCDNADFGGPASHIEVCSDWTDWKQRGYYDQSVVDALESAVAAKRLHESNAHVSVAEHTLHDVVGNLDSGVTQ